MELKNLNNRVCKFDYINSDILLGDGGLFSIKKEIQST